MSNQDRQGELGVAAVLSILFLTNYKKIVLALEKIFLLALYGLGAIAGCWCAYQLIKYLVNQALQKWRAIWAWVARVEARLEEQEKASKEFASFRTDTWHWESRASRKIGELEKKLLELSSYVATLKKENRLVHSDDQKNKADPTAEALESISQ